MALLGATLWVRICRIVTRYALCFRSLGPASFDHRTFLTPTHVGPAPVADVPSASLTDRLHREVDIQKKSLYNNKTPPSAVFRRYVLFRSFFVFSPEQPPPEFLYLDGLTELFLSKIRDAHCLPGRAFAPIVSITVQQSWEWTKPEGAERPMPGPALPWERAGRGGSGAQEEDAAALAAAAAAAAAATAVTLGEQHRGRAGNAATSAGHFVDPSMAAGSQGAAAAAAVPAEKRAARGVVGARQDAVGKLLRAVGGGGEEDEAEKKTGVVPLWGPDEVWFLWYSTSMYGSVRSFTPPLPRTPRKHAHFGVAS